MKLLVGLFRVVLVAAVLCGPAQARFYATDPAGYQDQLNLYSYVHNDPVNMWDPNGEEAACFYVGSCNTVIRPFHQGFEARFASVGANARYISDVVTGNPGAGFVETIDNALTTMVLRNPGAAFSFAADQYLDQGLEYNMGNAVAGAVLGYPLARGAGAGVGATVLGASTLQNVSGSGMRSIYSAYDALTNAGVSPGALSSKALAGIAEGVANRATFSYDAETNSVMGSYSTVQIGSRIPVKIEIEVDLDDETR